MLKFEPLLKERIWGSDRLGRVFGKAVAAGSKVGESWEVADLPGECVTVAEGPLAGMSLRAVLEKHGAEFGFSEVERAFPFGLLIKYLDAADTLSVQVHPDEAACQRMGTGRPKTECWYVLDAERGAVIYRGLKDGVGRGDVAAVVRDGRLEELLVAHPARRGDFHFLPAGTIHALGAGTLVAEVQIPSDTTYRLYDWNRVDAQGRPRELHVEQALESIHYTDGSGGQTAAEPAGEDVTGLEAMAGSLGAAYPLVHCPYFSVVRVEMAAGRRWCEVGRPTVVMRLRGVGWIESANGEGYGVAAGDTVLLGGGEGFAMAGEEPAECLLVRLGPEKVR